GGALILVAAERARDFPQSLPLAPNRGPVYLLGTGESVEMPMVTLTRHSREKRESRAARVSAVPPWTPASAGATITHCHAESVRQMRGVAPAQIPGAKISVCHGVGGMFAASGTIIMSNE